MHTPQPTHTYAHMMNVAYILDNSEQMKRGRKEGSVSFHDHSQNTHTIVSSQICIRIYLQNFDIKVTIPLLNIKTGC